jgi:hypothetical protein
MPRLISVELQPGTGELLLLLLLLLLLQQHADTSKKQQMRISK